LKALERIVALDPQAISDITILCRVDVDQLTGIEIEENPAAIAEVATWITDHQMNRAVSDTFGRELTRLPLVRSARVIRANALQTNWRELFQEEEWASGKIYVFGNPPFVAKANRNAQQNGDQDLVMRGMQGAGILDYVTGWLVKAAQTIEGTRSRAAFVTTNSITQGEQVAVVWGYLRQRGMRIFFAHRTFKWRNEAPGQAAVFCVVVGFSPVDIQPKRIFDYESPDSEPLERTVSRISPYLIEADEGVLVTARSTPLCDAPEIRFGSMPNDGGALLFSPNERDAFLREEPGARSLFRQFLGSEEFINGIQRYCLWLKDVDPAELRRLPHVLARVDAVRRHRQESRRPQTNALAATPTLFGEDRQPTTKYILVPKTSSERRKYIPIAFIEPEIVGTECLMIEGADAFHFGVLSSAMHMAWVRMIGGRLKGDYRYSNKIVYNNFPWPREVSERQRQRLVDASESVVTSRARYPDSTLADLYDPLTMPADLVEAHSELDRAVDRCYRATAFRSEAERLEFLLRLYAEYTAPLVRPPRRSRARRVT
jgi:hypothetical protein